MDQHGSVTREPSGSCLGVDDMPLNRADLLALMAIKFPDNHQGLITPAFARSFFTELINAVCLYNQIDQHIEVNSGFFSDPGIADGGSGILANFTADQGRGPFQKGTNNTAITITAPVQSGSCQIAITNGASAGAITLAGFTETAGTPDTTEGNVWMLTIVKIDTSVYGSWTQIA